MASKYVNMQKNGIRVVGNKLIIELQYLDPLNAETEYELKIPNNAIRDYAGNNIESPTVKLVTGLAKPLGFDIIDNTPYDNAIKVTRNPEICLVFNKEWKVDDCSIYFGTNEWPGTKDITVWSEWTDPNHEADRRNVDVEIWKRMIRYYPVPHLDLNPSTGLPYGTSYHNPPHKIADILLPNTTYHFRIILALNDENIDLTRYTKYIRLHLIFTTAEENEWSYSGGTGIAGTDSCKTRIGGTGGTGESNLAGSEGLPGYGGMPGLWNFCREKGGTGGTGGTGNHSFE